MNKGIITVLFVALLLAPTALAAVSPYVEPLSMVAEGGAAYGGVERVAPFSGVIRKIGFPATPPCRLNITVDPQNRYFFGEARRQCNAMNKGNLYCEEKCVDRMKLMVYTSSWDRGLGLYSTYSCKAANIDAINNAGSVSRCYFIAKDECALANPENDYCRRKCMQNSYAICRQNIAQMRYR